MRKLYILFCILLLSWPVPNHAQFMGGEGDGVDKSGTIQVSLQGTPQGTRVMFAGGEGDGFYKAASTASLNGFSATTIFAGGKGDGHDKDQTGGTLGGFVIVDAFYAGGEGDGFDKGSVGSSLGGFSTTNMYAGGEGDGFDKDVISSFLSGLMATGLFSGGEGDGFSKDKTASSLGGATLTMFNGGEGDGFDKDLVASSLSGIATTGMWCGGDGDGFDSDRFDGLLSPFPVALLTFDAFPDETFVLVQWVTEKEINNDFFTVERTIDGSYFKEIATVPSQGNSEWIQSYKTEDLDPAMGTSYYRLKWTDLNGVSDYSEMVEVYYEGKDDFSLVIFPNPSKGDQLHVNLTGLTQDDELAIEVYDMTGKMVFVTVDPHRDTPGNTFTLNLKGQLAEGSYVVRVLKNIDQQASKILIITK